MENGTYLQGLNSLYKISGKTMENSDIGISRDSHQEGYTLIGFDVDPTISLIFIMLVNRKKVTLKLEIKFKSGLPNSITLYFVCNLS